MYILGINAYHGDASAALMKDGELVLAIEEERLNRQKHCAGFPTLAIKACLEKAGITISEVHHVAISTNPSANLKEKVLYGLKRFSKIHKMLFDRITKVSKTGDLRSDLAKHLGVSPSDISAKMHNVEHHLAHLATAFYVSPFDKSALLTLDGMGDFVSSKWAIGDENEVKILGQIEYPHSIGYLYTAVTQYLGFPYYGDEGKVMGLAPYGKPVYMDIFRDIIKTPKQKIGYELDLSYFLHHEQGIEMKWDDGAPSVGKMFSDKLEKVLGPARVPKSEYTDHFNNVAASLQKRVEEVGLDMMDKLQKETGLKRLGLAGGVALNSVMNGKILANTDFEDVYIHPNAGDGGTSLGAALWVLKNETDFAGEIPSIEHGYLGSEFSSSEVGDYLQSKKIDANLLDDAALFDFAANDIADGNVVGWFQGKMEWGPRALGSRSIVADPRRADMKDILNARIKKREHFRPFAPSILEEYTSEYFEEDYPAPTMLMVYPIREEKRKVIPAVTHVDGSGRLQTVRAEHNERYYNLISAFHKITGVPIVLNTSFNENEPVVCTPDDAFLCFERTKMDILYLGNYRITRDQISG